MGKCFCFVGYSRSHANIEIKNKDSQSNYLLFQLSYRASRGVP